MLESWIGRIAQTDKNRKIGRKLKEIAMRAECELLRCLSLNIGAKN